MSLQIASLNSGSNGNCYYIGNETEAVLVDAGISCRETEKRMNRLGLSMEKVKAIFISHEHGDHITGLPAISKKYRTQVYITPNTLAESRLPLDVDLVNSFKPNETICIGGLSITNFPKFHDAADPYSFVISSETVNVGVFTDIGKVCKQVIRHFQQCHAVFLEANYDETMLEKGRYTQHLKNRIRGGQGHLSNDQALQLFLEHRPPYLSHLLLSHLSKNNNDPGLVSSLFTKHAAHTRIIIASRYNETEVYHINAEGSGLITGKKLAAKKPDQLSLF
jgi:phosphoribosyl 1,2-cyclic phosphodiesterase